MDRGGLHLEWDSDKSTNRCVLCSSKWTLTNRRHHCRNCGRLVCKSCSGNFLKLKQVYNGASAQIGSTGAGGGGAASFSTGQYNDGDFDGSGGVSRMSMVSIPEIDGIDSRSSVASSKRGVKKGLGDDNLKAQRVCDGCYKALSVKKNLHIEQNLQKEREVMLLSSTSFVSESLIKVFLLDCSFKTICYDDTMTAADVCTMLCYSLKIALFEVEKDIRDHEQYRMIQPHELITDVVHRWAHNQLNYAKLVLPIYDLEACKMTQSPYLLSVTKISPSKLSSSNRSGSGVGRTKSNSMGPATPSLYPCVIEVPTGGPPNPSSFINNPNAAVDSLDEDTNRKTIYGSVKAATSAGTFDPLTECDVEVLRAGYLDLQRKHNMLKTVFAKKQSRRISDGADGSSIVVSTRISHSNSISASQADKFASEVNFINSSSTAGVVAPPHAASAAGSSAGPNSLFKKYTRSSHILSSSPYIRESSSVAGNNACSHIADLSSFDAKLLEETRHGSFGDMLGESSSPRRRLYAGNYNSSSSSNQADTSSSPRGNNGDNQKKTAINYSPLSDMSATRQRSAPSADLHDVKGVLLGRDDILTIFDSALQTSAAGSTALGAEQQRDSTSRFSHVVKTFFYQVYGIETFCQKFDKYLSDFISESTRSANQSIDLLTDASRSRSLLHDYEAEQISARSPSSASTDPMVITEVYEMASTIQSLYEFILKYSENWNHTIKEWLLELLKVELDKVIISSNSSGSSGLRSAEVGGAAAKWDGRVLAAVISSLDRENLLTDLEVVKIVSDTIDCLLKFLDTVGSKTSSIAQFLCILDQINLALLTVSELSLLFPPEANVINIFNTRATQILSSSVVPFYLSRKHDLSTQDLLKFLNFTDLQVQVLGRLDVDVSVCSDLNGEIIRQLMTAVSKAWRALLGKLEEDEEVSLPQTGPSDLSAKSLHRLQGAHSSWPAELSRQFDEVLLLGKDKLIDFALETIREFISVKQTTYINKFKTASTNVLCSLEEGAAAAGTAGGGGSDAVSCLCACINNHFHFADMLADRKESIIAGRKAGISADGGGSRVLDAFTLLISIGAQQQGAAAAALAAALCNEVKEAIKIAFAKDWESSSNVSLVIHKRCNTCSKVMVSLYHMMLRVDELVAAYLQKPLYNCYIKIIFANVVKCIIDSYVENLVLRDSSSCIGVNNATFERISGDLLIINYTIEVLNEKYGFGSITPTIVNPLSDVIALLRINTRMIADFAVDSMGRYFSPAQVLRIVQNVLVMRSESKNIADAIILAVGSNASNGNSSGRLGMKR